MPVVIDLSALWAGPLCSNLLGLTGARVIKVESLSRPDAMRAGAPRFFDVLNSQSESVVLDLRTPAGIAALRALAQAADIVVESSRPRALAQLGIDAAEVASAGTTWVSITAYGRAGERSNCVGFGDDVAAAAGLVALEPETGAPLPCGDAIADPLAGAIAAVAALASVRAGGGHLIDVPMYDVSAWAATAQTDDTPAPRLAPKPRARTPSGHSTPLGHDTRRILDELLGKQ
jgi:crotonobetainyl-CoA:carnitine CoA-transferase CaiB-like acyl-CoA transferase